MNTQPAATKRIIIELVATILVPIVAIPLAVIHFVRERVGAGLGLLLTMWVASAIWFGIIFAVALHNNTSHETARVEQQVAASAPASEAKTESPSVAACEQAKDSAEERSCVYERSSSAQRSQIETCSRNHPLLSKFCESAREQPLTEAKEIAIGEKETTEKNEECQREYAERGSGKSCQPQCQC
jgi:hypothetical protein